MELISGLFNTEYFHTLIGPDLVKYVVMVAIIIKTVGGHFKDMKDAVTNLTAEIHSLKEIFSAELRKTDLRFKEIEDRNEAIIYRVYALELKLTESKEG